MRSRAGLQGVSGEEADRQGTDAWGPTHPRVPGLERRRTENFRGVFARVADELELVVDPGWGFVQIDLGFQRRVGRS